jgi:hypothetical protein
MDNKQLNQDKRIKIPDNPHNKGAQPAALRALP